MQHPQEQPPDDKHQQNRKRGGNERLQDNRRGRGAFRCAFAGSHGEIGTGLARPWRQPGSHQTNQAVSRPGDDGGEEGDGPGPLVVEGLLRVDKENTETVFRPKKLADDGTENCGRHRHAQQRKELGQRGASANHHGQSTAAESVDDVEH